VKEKNVLPTLYKLASNGSIQQWTIWSEGNSYYTEFGKVGGKLQITAPTLAVAKNTGRANETSAEQQAALEAKAAWEKKLKSGYVESIAAARGGVVSGVVQGGAWPMLAKVYSKDGSKIKWPAYVQPKLDGHRCIAVIDKDGKCSLWSRTRKPINSVPHIVKELERLKLKNIILDGELYNQDYADKFEELCHFIRQSSPIAGCDIVQYHVYDIVDATMTFEARSKVVLDSIAGSGLAPAHVIPVDTLLVNSPYEMLEKFEGFKAAGYEGCMVRNAAGRYVGSPSHRSDDLQKVKSFDDAEFEIVGVTEGLGKLAGCGIFECKTTTGATFEAKMVGKLEDLKQYFEKPETVIGKMLTVKYQGLTAKSGVPRFPVGLRIREPE